MNKQIVVMIAVTLFSGSQVFAKKVDHSVSENLVGVHHYSSNLSGSDVIGHTVTIKAKLGQTLASIGQQYDIGITEMRDANPNIKPRKILIRENIVLPMQYVLPPQKYRKGIVINVPELRLYHFSADGIISTYPVALGRKKWRTPVGKTWVVGKKEGPTWHVPASIKAEARKNGRELPDQILPGPNNPLGPFAIYLGMQGYLIHGTINPASIGKLVSSGCVRMHNKDITDLYAKVKKGDPVNIIYYPNKVGWHHDKLYLESHFSFNEEDDDIIYHDVSVDVALAEALAKNPKTMIDWEQIDKVLLKHSGVPTNVRQTILSEN